MITFADCVQYTYKKELMSEIEEFQLRQAIYQEQDETERNMLWHMASILLTLDERDLEMCKEQSVASIDKFQRKYTFTEMLTRVNSKIFEIQRELDEYERVPMIDDLEFMIYEFNGTRYEKERLLRYIKEQVRELEKYP